MNAQITNSRAIPDTIIFDLEESRRGFRINEMCNSLKTADNRDAYLRDDQAYLTRYKLSDNEKQLILARDWAGLIEAGANIYFLLKLGFVVHQGLYHMGAQMRGESFEEFLATRNGNQAR